MAYANTPFTSLEQPTLSKWNQLWDNDAYLYGQVGANFGSGTASKVWWEELGRTTLGASNDTVSVASFAARKYLRFAFYGLASGQISLSIRFNNDSGANYSIRQDANGAADATAGSQTSLIIYSAGTRQSLYLDSMVITNIAAQEKIFHAFGIDGGTAGAANPPGRTTQVCKWANTSNQITRIDAINTGTGDFASGSELIVLGHD